MPYTYKCSYKMRERERDKEEEERERGGGERNEFAVKIIKLLSLTNTGNHIVIVTA